MNHRELIRDVTNQTEPCPFCGSDDNEHRTLMAVRLAATIHYVKCESCAACGPISVEYPDAMSAIDSWNERTLQNQVAELLDIAEQALSGVDIENRQVLGFAGLLVLKQAVDNYRGRKDPPAPDNADWQAANRMVSK